MTDYILAFELLQQGGLIVRSMDNNGIDTARCYHLLNLAETPLNYEKDVAPLVDADVLDMEYPNEWDSGLMFYRLKEK